MQYGHDHAFLDGDAIGEYAAAAEKAGFDAVSVTEHPIPNERWLGAGGHNAFDPFVELSFAAAATSRLRLLTNITVVPYRNPFLLAKSAASLDRLSKGRLETMDDLAQSLAYLREHAERVGRTQPIDVSSSALTTGAPGTRAFDPNRSIEEVQQLTELGVTWYGVGGFEGERGKAMDAAA